MDERVQFVAECLRGQETVAELCRAYGVSRKTAYKWIGRYREHGPKGLEDRSSRPRSNSRSPSDQVVRTILQTRRDHPTWGPRKLRAWLTAKHPDCTWPSASTIGNLLTSYGLVTRNKRRRRAPPSEYPFAECSSPNDVWCVDFKGHFKMGNNIRCHPLTMTDAHSRYLLLCKGMSGPTLASTQAAMEAAFREYGLPSRMRSDNGVPFAGAGAGGLSRLSIWWLKLGILPERIEPGKPQQNGRHERFHRTLKAASCRPPAKDLRRQQNAFDRFRTEYNDERPHEALDDQTPGQVYEPSRREFPSKLPAVEHPDGAAVRKVIANGRVRWRGHFFFVNSALTGEEIAVFECDDGRFELRFGPIHLGFFDPRRPSLGLIRAERALRRAARRA